MVSTEEKLIGLYKLMDYILHINDGWLWQDIPRVVGGWIVFLLSWLNSFVEGIIDKVITLNDFYSTGPIKEFMDVARPIVWGVFFIALFVLGFQFMLNKIEKRNEIILNVVLALSFIVVIPDLMINMGKVTEFGVEQINPEKKSLSSELVKSNVADIRYYAEKGFKFSNEKNGDGNLPPRPMSKNDSQVGTTDFTYANRLSEKSIPYISFIEKLDVTDNGGDGEAFEWGEKLKDKNEDAYKVLKNKLVATGNGDEFKVAELRKNQVPTTKLGIESYYRYHVNWGVLIFSLLVTTLALVITMIKIGRSIFDLAFHQIFGMFVVATDLTGGQRTKKVLVEITNTFAIIFIMTMLLKIFMMYSVWANGLKGSIGGIGVLLLLIAGAWALIDAPDIVTRMMGIDAGLRNGWQAMMGAYAGAKVAGAGAKVLGKGTTAAGNIAAGGINFARRMGEGIYTKTPEELAKGKGGNGISKIPVKQIPGTSKPGEIPKQNEQDKLNSSIPTESQGGYGKETAIPPKNEGHMERMEGISTQSDTNVEGSGGPFVVNQREQMQSPFPSDQDGFSSQTSNNGGSNTIPSENETSNSIPSQSTRSASAIPQERIARDGSILKYGHKEANHTNTWIGGSRPVRNAKENWTRAGNSGFSLGQNIRRIGNATGKATIQTTRAVIHPKQTLQAGVDKVKNIKQTGSDQIKTPPSQKMIRKENDDE